MCVEHVLQHKLCIAGGYTLREYLSIAGGCILEMCKEYFWIKIFKTFNQNIILYVHYFLLFEFDIV